VHLPLERLLCEPEEFRVLYKKLCNASVAMGTESGWDPEFGRGLPPHLVRAGLDSVGSEVCTPLIIGGSLESEFPSLSLHQLRRVLVDAGYLSDDEVDYMIDALAKPETMVAGYSMVSAWGRRPA
jgi:hypothetical protein